MWVTAFLHILFSVCIVSTLGDKIGTTRCQILRQKCTHFDIRWGSNLDPTGRVYSTPPDLVAELYFKELTFKSKGERKWDGKGGGENRNGSERKVKGKGSRVASLLQY